WPRLPGDVVPGSRPGRILLARPGQHHFGFERLGDLPNAVLPEGRGETRPDPPQPGSRRAGKGLHQGCRVNSKSLEVASPQQTQASEPVTTDTTKQISEPDYENS